MQAMELAASAGRPEDATALRPKARAALLAAGDRALNLDVARAESSYSRALQLYVSDEADRRPALERWANAAAMAGKLDGAMAALREVVEAYRTTGQRLALGRALTALGRLQSRIGEANVSTTAEAVQLLEAEPPSVDLVTAYAQHAAALGGAGDNGAAIASAESSLSLAESMGLEEPPMALGFKGLFRCLSGERDGLKDMQRALSLAVARGLGRETAVLYANTAFVIGMLEGPSAELAAIQRALEFAERIGNLDTGGSIASTEITLMYDTGQWDAGLAKLRKPGGTLAMPAGLVDERQVRWVQARISAHRGDGQAAQGHAEWLLRESKLGSEVQWLASGLSSAALALAAAGRLRRAHTVLTEFERHPEARADRYQYALALPELVRTAIACADIGLARRLVTGVEPLYPPQESALLAARAAVTEADGDLAHAVRLYERAVDGWRRLVYVPELAFALLGLGRCRWALGEDGSIVLREAREIFTKLNASPLVEAVDRVIDQGRTQAEIR
jgi:tetratricopeptide (TPR) repeat protein